MYLSSLNLANQINGLGEKATLFLDLDGTIIDIADHPDKVVIDKGLEETLIQLSKRFQIAIITGRDPAFIDESFPNLKPAFSASHGAFIRYEAHGEIERLAPKVDTPKLKEMIESYWDKKVSQSGMWVEEKPTTSCNIHWRISTIGLDKSERIAFHTASLAQASYNSEAAIPLTHRIALTHGDMVIELGSAHADKGTAIKMFMDQDKFKGLTPIFAGDSKADIPGFEVVKSLNGLSIGVSSDVQGHAKVAVTSPEDFRDTLKLLSHNL